MGSFTRHYKLWLWDSGASTWREVTRASNFEMSYFLNYNPTMQATVYLTDSNLQNLMVAGTPFRVTNNASTDGTVETGLLGETLNETGAASGSREIIVGTLKDPNANQRSSQRNNSPVIWDIQGVGYSSRLRNIVRDAETTRTNSAGTVITNYVNNDIPDSSAVALGTIDTGPSISVKHRKDKLYDAVLDICGVGDSSNNFYYYAHVNDDGSRTPQLNYLAPDNALFEVTDPLDTDGMGTRDEGRIIKEASEARDVTMKNEEERIRNAVKIRWAGIGSGSSQNETAFTTDATSISTFGRRESIDYAPWVQNSTTATTLRDTLEDMFDGADFRGTYDGIKRARISLRTGELFNSAFDAHPGDRVSLERDGSEVLVGRFLGFTFKQAREELIVEIGIPKINFLQRVRDSMRHQRQVTNSIEATTSNPTSAESTGDGGGSVTFQSSDSHSYSNVADLSTSTNTFTIPTGDGNGLFVKVEGFPSGSDGVIGIYAELQASGFNTRAMWATKSLPNTTSQSIQNTFFVPSNYEGGSLVVIVENATGATRDIQINLEWWEVLDHTHGFTLPAHTHPM